MKVCPQTASTISAVNPPILPQPPTGAVNQVNQTNISLQMASGAVAAASAAYEV